MSWVLANARRRAQSKKGFYRDALTQAQISGRHADEPGMNRTAAAEEGRGGAKLPFGSLIAPEFAHLADYAAELAEIELTAEVWREDIPPYGNDAHLKWAPSCTCAGEFNPASPPKSRPGLTLDPFTGVATTGIAALRNGRDFLGVELSENYAREAEWRIREEVGSHFQPKLEI